MNLIDQNIKIGVIALDPLNPRDNSFAVKTQNDILSSTMKKQEAKELLRSMKQCIRWVNKIVVVSIKDYLLLHPEPMDASLENFKYVVVEGNTRLSCLKSKQITAITEETEIPVLVAQKESRESIEEFRESILITQGIANVTEVKPWSDISKAKHIHDMYKLKITNFNGQKTQQIHKEAIQSISEQLGLSQDEIRKNIRRYTIYAKIEDVAEQIPDDKWGFLEALEINATTRNFIGLTDTFDWDDEKAEAALSIIPDLFKNEASFDPNSKHFRDNFRDYISECDTKKMEHQDIIENLSGIINSKEEKKSIVELIYDRNIKEDNKEKWEKFFKDTASKLKEYPINEDWAQQHLEQFGALEKQIQKIQKQISVANE